jgi:hypothetical protein
MRCRCKGIDMRGMLTRLVVALCTFTGGLAASFLMTTHRLDAQISKTNPCTATQVDEKLVVRDSSDGSPASPNAPVLDYHEVINNADCLSGKTMRMRANLSFDEHGMFFHHGERDDGGARTAGRIAGLNYLEEFNRILNEACESRCLTAYGVVVLGKFEKLTPSRESNLLSDQLPHHFQIDRVESVRTAR